MMPASPDFPEPFSAVLARLQELVGRVQDAAASAQRAVSSLADEIPAMRSAAAQEQADILAIEAPLSACAQALRDCGRVPLALVVQACADVLRRMPTIRAVDGPQALQLMEQALQAVRARAEQPGGDEPDAALALFPLYQSVQHLAGVARAHPADLWAGPALLADLPADPFVAARELDGLARGDLEAALLACLQQPQAASLRAMSELCAALGEGTPAPQAGLWKLACAVYEAQALALLAVDVHLKRIGPRLLSLARASQGDAGVAPAAPRGEGARGLRPTAQESARQLGHELLFHCLCALVAAQTPGAPAAGPWLERVGRAYGLPPRRTLEADGEKLTSAGDLQDEREDTTAASSRVPVPLAPAVSVAPAAPALPVPSVAPVAPVAPAPLTLLAAPVWRALPDAVPGLPSAADLDVTAWGLAANADHAAVASDEIKVIGGLRLEIPAFNVFLNDADEASRQLCMVLAEWAERPDLPAPAQAAVQARSLAQGAERMGHVALASLSLLLAQVLQACAAPQASAAGGSSPEPPAQSLCAAAEEIRRVLHQFAAGFLTEPSAACQTQLGQCLAELTPPCGFNPAA